MSDRDVMLMERENNRLADLDADIEARSTVLYFDAFDDLARDGKLADPRQQDDLGDALWLGLPGGINCDHIMQLVGEVHQVSSLDTAGRERKYAAIGRYIAGIVEEHVLRIADAAATKECS